jgi:hypothetical protein
VIRVAGAGSPVTGVGGIYYMLLFAISIVFRLYRRQTRAMRKSKIVIFAMVAVYFIVILSILQAFRVINLGETLSYLLTSMNTQI